MGGLPYGYEMGVCRSCGKIRLVHTENGLCMPCENNSLKERTTELELELSAYRRSKNALAHENFRLRMQMQTRETA